MPGVFKKLNAQDIKITPFEAHKQYNTVNLSSIGASTASLSWSGNNKSEFSTGSRQYYQIDKLYYRNYIRERAHRLELDDATYTTQERRLYKSASLLSLSQKTFGSEVQPNNLSLTVSKGGSSYTIVDDGFGNLYDINIGKDNFPNEDNRVLYISPVEGFKRVDLNLDYETGDSYVNAPFPDGYDRTVYDDSYFQNTVTYYKTSFGGVGGGQYGVPFITLNDRNDSRVTIENRSYLNFNNDDFAISFYYKPSIAFNTWVLTENTEYILTKEGAQNTTPLGTQIGGAFSLSTSGALDITTTPSNPAFPYRLSITGDLTGGISGSLTFERYDGETLSSVTAPIYLFTDLGDLTHVLVQKKGNLLEIYKNGVLVGSGNDNTKKACQNRSDITLFKKRNPNGSYNTSNSSNFGDSNGGFNLTQLQIWNQSMSTQQIAMVSESFTGTYPIGNAFYDNGFITLTHPKYMGLFDGGSLDSLSYKNTHLITENEYQCTMTEDEFEFTTNVSARKIPFSNSEDIANFATGSNFKPYITTVGLYDNDGNLLVVGKLAQPIRASSETDTTFIIRFDT